jgi:aspartate carbamoyltransferase catalytic subunit
MSETRHLLSTSSLSTDLVKRKIDRAEELRGPNGREHIEASREEIRQKIIGGAAIYILMLEASTRTVDKHDFGAHLLGGHTRIRETASQTSSLVKGESKKDMIYNIAAQDWDALVIRDRALHTAKMAAEVSSMSVINAGNGWDDHPTQAEADIYTMYRELDKEIEGRTVVIAGDNYHGRVNRADIRMFSKFGNRLVLASLPGLEIQDNLRRELEEQQTSFVEVYNLENAMEFNPDFVVLSRFQRERYVGENPRTGENWETERIERDFHEKLALTKRVVKAAPPHTKFAHPLPRGPELPDDDNPQVVIWPQVKNAKWMTVTDYEYILNLAPFNNV